MAAVWFNEPVSALAHPKWVTCFYKMKSIESTIGVTKMKHHLIAVAALAACGTAFAQSSVTVYGVADVGVGKIQAPTGNDDSNKWEMTSHSLMNNGASRIGFRGVEDLGGGLKAGFNFESGLDLDDGAATTPMWTRAANVWIGGNWGQIQLGRGHTPSYYGMTMYELTGDANYSALTGVFGFGASYNSRNDSQFMYRSPNWGGFAFSAAYISKNDIGANKWDLGLTYNNGPLAVGLSANKRSGDKLNYAVGAKYQFGAFAIASSFQDARSIDRYPANAGVFQYHRRGVTLGGSVNVGAFSFTADLVRDLKIEANGMKEKKLTNGVVEAKYALSKRTFFYGAYLRLNKTNNYGVGLRHNF